MVLLERWDDDLPEGIFAYVTDDVKSATFSFLPDCNGYAVLRPVIPSKTRGQRRAEAGVTKVKASARVAAESFIDVWENLTADGMEFVARSKNETKVRERNLDVSSSFRE